MCPKTGTSILKLELRESAGLNGTQNHAIHLFFNHRVNHCGKCVWEEKHNLKCSVFFFSDPRCDSYPFLGAPDKMLAIIGLYLFIVWQGPKWMVPYKPWDLKNTIIIYNFAMVILSTYISIGVSDYYDLLYVKIKSFPENNAIIV